MPKAAIEKKRPYMASHQRRQALLEVASEIVAQRGLSGLTMKGLATEAGVSRQLVYDHFEDGAGLLLSTIKHLFEGAHRATTEVLQSRTGDLSSTIREAYRIFLDLPAAQRRVLRTVPGDFVSDPPETRRAIALMREQTVALWLPYARSQTGLTEHELRPLVWMFNGAAWSLADLVDEGTVSKERATGLLARMFEQVMMRENTQGRRRKAAASPRPRKGRTSRKED